MKTLSRGFFIGAFGRSGTVWLAKLLNGHPDVFCSHEGVLLRQYPQPWYEAGARETLQWIQGLTDLAQWNVGLAGYRAVGDANSIGGFHRACPLDNELFRATSFARIDRVLGRDRLFLLLREPTAAIESKHRMLQPHRNVFLPYARRYVATILAGSAFAEREWAHIARDNDDAALRVMLMLHWRFVAQLPHAQAFRLEEIGSDRARATAAAAQITGVEEGWSHVAAACRRRENEGASVGGAGDIADESLTWSSRERAAFADLCAPWALQYGYSTVEPTSSAAQAIPMLDRPAPKPSIEGLVSAFGSLRVGVFGAGENGRTVREALRMLGGPEPSWFADNDAARHGTRWCESPVISPQVVLEHAVDKVVVGSIDRENIERQLAEIGVERSRIVSFNVRMPTADMVEELYAALASDGARDFYDLRARR